MSDPAGSNRRDFLKQAAVVSGTASAARADVGKANVSKADPNSTRSKTDPSPARAVPYPRTYSHRQLARIAFPLGGVAAGSLSLGGRGQLRDWEIFNRPDKGHSPPYAFPAIWAQAGDSAPVCHVLESRILPPYDGPEGLGSSNAPGLSRLASSTFIGEYPLAKVVFEDARLPVNVELEAFSPFIPHDAEDSGLPVAILRYRVQNHNASPAKVSIAFSIDNPLKVTEDHGAASLHSDSRENEILSGGPLSGLVMRNPALAATDPMAGEFVICTPASAGGEITNWRGWPQGRWWNSPMLFWDDFSDDGQLGAEPAPRNAVGVVSLNRTIAPRQSADFTFFLAWRFPNRTPRWCGWSAPKGDEDTLIGNHYCTRFASAWEAAEYAARNLDRLEARTRLFVTALRESTLPPLVKEAAAANLSTLASTVCFRTADGEFHGFEGVSDHSGCCSGNCTHVWNYETTTPHLFPSLARSLRKAAFGYSMDDRGGIHFRQLLPDGKERSGTVAADGQMGQIMHAYMDWSLSGDIEWLGDIWPKIKKAIEFAWIAGGWDANKDGVLEGVQHNTYDVEFYGPNPMCGIYYLGALRAAEEMARAVGDASAAKEYRGLFDQGSRWIDANLFNGEYYIQRIRGFRKAEIAAALRLDMGADDPEHPDYQVGEGCLVDQLIGQCMADVMNLGPLVSARNVRQALGSIYRYNYKRTLVDHDSVDRTFALNDEPAIVICDYGKAPRPRIPFPYFSESMTGFEYSAATHMIYAGMVREGVECIQNVRMRFDGEKRNPWDEPECGHHYARAMAAWSGILALSGFRYHGGDASVIVMPRLEMNHFRCFWSNATGWGTFSLAPGTLEIRVLSGHLRCASCEFKATAGTTSATMSNEPLHHRAERNAAQMKFRFSEPVIVDEGAQLKLTVRV